MPSTKSIISISSSATHDHTARFEPNMPRKERDATHSVPFLPISAGTFILPKLRPATYRRSEYDDDDDEYYIARDLQNCRVFIDIDVFMEHVLHVPENWEELWAGTIRRIKRDPVFSVALREYTRRCGTQGIREHILYEPLADVASAILEICGSSPAGTKSRKPPRYLRDDATDPEYRPNKPWDNALVDGSCIPRLKVNGRDPRENHAHAEPTPSRKRPADVPLESNRKAVKVHLGSTPGGQPPKMKPPPLQKRETDQQKDAYHQVGRYIFKLFSIPTFRSQVTVGLVDRDRIQFYHANHSVILVSSAINFTTRGREGLDKFIAIMIAFRRLSLRDDGILHDLRDGQLKKPATSEVRRGTVQFQEGKKLVFGGDENTESFTLTYDEIISRDQSLVGRATLVLHVKSSSLWKELDLVVKISWSWSDRVAENEFLAKAVEIAKGNAEDNWALKHLPRVLFAQEVAFDSDSAHEDVAKLFDNAKFVDPKSKFIYQPRKLRVIVQERLHPTETLTDVKDVAQVLLDAGCVHRWLYLRAGILHRDISLTNIMCRIVKEENKDGVTEKKVYGVLTDFDLASWKKDLGKKIWRQKMGTVPFMAHELLESEESDPRHLYRHDLESLFYVMLVVASHYEIELPARGEDGGLCERRGLRRLPYQTWFDEKPHRFLSCLKNGTLMWPTDLNLSPAFEDFRGWLMELYRSLSYGCWAKENHECELQRCKMNGPKDQVMPTFNRETLGGYFRYSSLINPVRRLKGKLEGLIIRYDPPPQKSAGPVEANR